MKKLQITKQTRKIINEENSSDFPTLTKIKSITFHEKKTIQMNDAWRTMRKSENTHNKTISHSLNYSSQQNREIANKRKGGNADGTKQTEV